MNYLSLETGTTGKFPSQFPGIVIGFGRYLREARTDLCAISTATVVATESKS